MNNKKPFIVCTSLLGIVMILGLSVFWKSDLSFAGLPMTYWGLAFISFWSLIFTLIYLYWIKGMEDKELRCK